MRLKGERGQKSQITNIQEIYVCVFLLTINTDILFIWINQCIGNLPGVIKALHSKDKPTTEGKTFKNQVSNEILS